MYIENGQPLESQENLVSEIVETNDLTDTSENNIDNNLMTKLNFKNKNHFLRLYLFEWKKNFKVMIL